MSEQYPNELPRRRSAVERFFGGSPLGVIVRLLVVSLIVGFLMSVFGLRPQDIVDGAINLFHETFRDGFGLFRNLGAYIVTGAVLVIPIWLLIRLSKSRR